MRWIACRSQPLGWFVVGLLVSIPIAAEAALSEVPDAGWELDRRQERLGHGEGRRIVVVHPFGDVRFRRTEEPVVELSILEQYRSGASWRLEVAREADESEVRFVVAPRWVGDGESGEFSGRVDGRLDLVVFLPPGAPVSVETTSGLIEAKRLRHDIEARSEKGEIRLSTMGTVHAHSDFGDVSVAYGETAWAKTLTPKISTKTGSLRVILPPTADVAIAVETNGRITTDYSIEIDREPGQTLKRGRARIGRGERPLQLVSDRGTIEIFHDPGS